MTQTAGQAPPVPAWESLPPQEQARILNGLAHACSRERTQVYTRPLSSHERTLLDRLQTCADVAARRVDAAAARQAHYDWTRLNPGDQARLLREIARWAESHGSRWYRPDAGEHRRLAHYANVRATLLQYERAR